MLKSLPEFRKYVAIVGFNNVKIRNTDELFKVADKKKKADVEMQFFDADLIATWEHLYFAVLNAMTSFKSNLNISRSLTMETMLYASAQHQITKAMRLLGVKPSSSRIAVVAIGAKPEAIRSTLSIISRYLNAPQDDDMLELSKQKTAAIKGAFEISDVELKTIGKEDPEKALTSSIIERMALLATRH